MAKNFDCIVIGAGIIGVSTALSLQRQNRKVLLIDKSDIAGETSFGNAGVLAVSSIIPLNNPQLLDNLLPLIQNNSNGFQYNPSYLLQKTNWLFRFLNFAQQKYLAPRAKALNALIQQSTALHKEWLAEANASELLVENGWIKLYANEDSFQKSHYEHKTYNENNVRFETLTSDALKDISPIFSSPNREASYSHATFFPDAKHITDPQKAVQHYFELFKRFGGIFSRAEITAINNISTEEKDNESIWQVQCKALSPNYENYNCQEIVVAAGPWSNDVLACLPKKLAFTVPMAYENGAHHEFLADKTKIPCPFYDTAGGYVLTPMQNRYRMTCGVYFANKDNKEKTPLLNKVTQLAQSTFQLKPHNSTWYGARPTLPDSLPIIGESMHSGLWLATGHQHIGLSTGPATGELLANLIIGNKIDKLIYSDDTINNFRANRFG